jgi:hypothetical protein
MVTPFERYEQAVAYSAVEFDGDVYLKEATDNASEEYHEEDKNYHTMGSFTLTGDPVIITLVANADESATRSTQRSHSNWRKIRNGECKRNFDSIRHTHSPKVPGQ